MYNDLAKKEIDKISSISLPKTGPSYLLLTVAKMFKGYVGINEIREILPTKIPNQKRYKETIEKLKKLGLIEAHPDHPNIIRITPFGVKFLQCKND